MNNEHCIHFDDIQVDLIALRVVHGERQIHFTTVRGGGYVFDQANRWRSRESYSQEEEVK
jgi:hypothetical protein